MASLPAGSAVGEMERGPSERDRHRWERAYPILFERHASVHEVFDEARFERLFRASPIPMGMGTLDEGRILDVNRRACEYFGYAREEMVGRTVLELGLWADPDDWARTIATAQQAGEVRGLEARLRRRTGEVMDALLYLDLLPVGEAAPLLVGMLMDITERKRLEEERERLLGHLRRLTRRLVGLQERERREIARELHDEIGQLLTGLKLALEGAAGGVPREAPALVEELLARVRSLSMDLRPAILDDLGLLPALEWLAERQGAQGRVRVRLSHAGIEGRFAPELETAAFRIAQEALTNVARHARAAEATVRVEAGRGGVRLVVADRGVGFDPGLAAGQGLSGMRERAVLLGGRLTVDSAPGGGTRVEAILPLRRPPERA